MTTLRLMIPATWDASLDSCEWAILDRPGLGGVDSLDGKAKVLRRGKDILSALPQCDETEIVVPAAIVGFIPAQLPPGNHSKILNALPFLVEASLINPPEETHAVLAAQADSQIVVAVIQKAWMKRVLDRLARAEIFPSRMFPETLLPNLAANLSSNLSSNLAVNLAVNSWALVCRGHESFIRTSASQGFPLDVDASSETAPFVLTMALAQAGETKRPASLIIYGDYPAHAKAWATQLALTITRASQQEWFVSNTKPTVNLLQGDFQPSGGISRRLIAFKPVAISLLGLLLLQVSFSMVDYAIKARENRQLTLAMVTQFKATFPSATTIVDAPLQMQRNLDDLKHGAGQSGNADYIPLLASVTTSIGAISAERLKGMDYQNGKLTLNLLLPDMEQAQAIRQRLTTSGLSATIENPKPSALGLDCQLVISASAL